MTTADDSKTKTRIITLTNRGPVKIVEADWPIIAQAKGDSFRGDSQRYHEAVNRGECDEYRLVVRRHSDGRAIVYGKLSAAIVEWGQPAGGESWAGGELLIDTNDRMYLEYAIKRVGEYGRLPRSIIQQCLADLPPEEI